MNNPAQSLSNAVKFALPADSKTGSDFRMFAHISNGWLCATNGLLTFGHPIEEDLVAAPKLTEFANALSNVQEEMSIVQTDLETLFVNSGHFKGVVECTRIENVSIPYPDANIAKINDSLKAALKAVYCLAEKEKRTPGILLKANSVVCTDAITLLEAWHGIDLPDDLIVPKAFAVAVSKTKLELSGFGFSNSSVTFYFENGAWIKTQLFDLKFPLYEHLFSENLNLWKLPIEFFKCLKTVSYFSKNGTVLINNEGIFANKESEKSTLFKIQGFENDALINAKRLLNVKHAVDSMAFDKKRNRLIFTNGNLRGCIQCLENNTNDFDNIPF